ncbi:HAD family hydrolase [Ornithinimicrobium cavernae]|uniref:HAD family hydrolase n=1 Tax=Ornithinimicrobium cavernae TaxID=2666047 RepID=UPI000D688265|nr:HAD family hydrolase [Ornithinimicrobium cavernae]
MRPVRAVLFDWGGTLTPWHTIDTAAQWHAFAGEVASSTQEVAALAEQILRAESAAWHAARTDHRSARLDELLTGLGLGAAHPAYSRARSAYEQFWEPHTITDQQVRPLWEWLRDNGIRVGVLSNTIWSRDYHRGLFERDGVLHLIDGDVYSSEIPWTKPHPEAFRAAAAAVDTAPEDCVYVGDRMFEDVHGPQQVGMRAVWVPHSDIPAEQRVEVDTRPDAVAHSLAEIAGIVRGWNAGGPGG